MHECNEAASFTLLHCIDVSVEKQKITGQDFFRGHIHQLQNIPLCTYFGHNSLKNVCVLCVYVKRWFTYWYQIQISTVDRCVILLLLFFLSYISGLTIWGGTVLVQRNSWQGPLQNTLWVCCWDSQTEGPGGGQEDALCELSSILYDGKRHAISCWIDTYCALICFRNTWRLQT